jgi:hypothetical protein
VSRPTAPKATCPTCETEHALNKDGSIRRHGCVSASAPILISLPWARVPISQNQLRRTHYIVEAKLKAATLEEARWAIRAAKVGQLPGADVIRLHYRPSTRQIRDADGLAPTGKVVVDALVQEGVLPGDDFRYVAEAAYRIHPPQRGVPGAFWLEIVKEAA